MTCPNPNLPFAVYYFRQIPLVALTFLTLTTSSCVSKSKAKAQARDAYIAGEQAAMTRLAKAHESVVTFIGPVQFPTVQWNRDLTLAKAIIAAGYTGPAEPAHIMIVRNGQAIPVDPKSLLNGEDIPLLSGDLVQIAQ